MLCGLKTILTDMNILNSYRHIRPKKVKYPIPEIPDDSGKKSGTDWVLPKIIGSGRVSGTRQALARFTKCLFAKSQRVMLTCMIVPGSILYNDSESSVIVCDQ